MPNKKKQANPGSVQFNKLIAELPEKGENITKNEYTSNIRKKMVEMRDNRMGRRSR